MRRSACSSRFTSIFCSSSPVFIIGPVPSARIHYSFSG
jgi:hypothetical protein